MPRRDQTRYERAPVIAVVVPTHNRAELLERLVRALEAQDGVDAFEVVIVDDASTDDTRLELARLEASSTIALRIERLERNAGPATARNRGWRSTVAPLVAFTDDDCVPQKGWLRALVDGGAAADVVQGRTAPDPDQRGNYGPFSRALDIRTETGFYQTSNIAYRRTFLDDLGGFDERYRYPAGEDTDLAWRARDAGARTTFATDAVVYHDVRRSSFFTHLRDAARWEGVVLLARERPETRAMRHSRLFWRASHPPALLAGAGLALAALPLDRRMRWVGLACSLPYAHFRLRRERLPTSQPNQVATLPLALVADLTEVAVLAAASVRYRCLLL